MNTEKITREEIASLLISALPSRPNASAAFGGRGYTAQEMKEAFDRLPLFLIERFNSLIDDLTDTEDGSLAASLPTGIGEGHTLADLFSDIQSGALTDYLSAGEETLAVRLSRLEEEIATAASYDYLRAVPTGIFKTHTLADLITDLRSGALSQYFVTMNGVLEPRLCALESKAEATAKKLRENATLTGLKSGHTLADLFADIKSGALAGYLETAKGKLEARLTDTEEALSALGEEKLGESAPTGISDGHTLSDLFADIKDGTILGYIPKGDTVLSIFLDKLAENIRTLSEKPSFSSAEYKTGITADQTLDGFFLSLTDGSFFDTVTYESETLASYLDALSSRLASLESGETPLTLDCGSPAARA